METYQIDDTHRLIAEVDETLYSVFDILGDGWNICTTNCADRLAPINYGSLFHELQEIKMNFDYYDKQHLAHLIKLYLSIKGIAYKEVSLRGYSQGEWHDVIVYNTSAADDASWLNDASSFESLRAWYRGDVYAVKSQKLTKLVDVDEVRENFINGNLDEFLTSAVIREEWEDVDYLFGVLLTDDYGLANLTNEMNLD